MVGLKNIVSDGRISFSGFWNEREKETERGSTAHASCFPRFYRFLSIPAFLQPLASLTVFVWFGGRRGLFDLVLRFSLAFWQDWEEVCL